MQEKYNVTGMTCAACQARVQKSVSNLTGVQECNVNLLKNSIDDVTAMIDCRTDWEVSSDGRGNGGTVPAVGKEDDGAGRKIIAEKYM